MNQGIFGLKMAKALQQAVTDFHTYPSLGDEDWQYAFQAAQVRSLETQLLTRHVLRDMANSENFDQAADLLSGTEYALPAAKDFAQVEPMLAERRTAARGLFAELMLDEKVVTLFKARDDFTNLRLALRRTLTDKPIGADYSSDGNASPDLFNQVFAEDHYELFPEYMQKTIEQAVLAYYQKKDIRQVDFAVDAAEAQHCLAEAQQLKSVFLLSLFKLRIDLTNIRTMLRLKFADSDLRNVFLEGGFVETDKCRQALDLGYEALAPLFFATPYHHVADIGTAYLASDKSFLKLEQQCDDYLNGFLRSTVEITAGPQPVIAFLLIKENEIRNVRLILTAKKNSLNTQLILDRIS